MNTCTCIGVSYSICVYLGVWRYLQGSKSGKTCAYSFCTIAKQTKPFIIHFIYKPKNKKVMKKFFFSLVAAMMATSAVFAQGSLLATLSHDGNISAYYGANALKTAVDAAKAGDVITLSSGQFNAVNITKPITLRGAGMSVSTDSVAAHEATIVQNAFEINIADSLSGRLLMEGLYFRNGITYKGYIKNAQFMKCRFENFIAGTSAKMTNSTFIHCRINNGFTLNSNSSNAYFINSLICSPYNYNSNGNGISSSNIEFDNCFIKFDIKSTYGYPYLVQNSYYKNCIIQRSTYSGSISQDALPSSCTAYNCVGIGNTTYSLFYYMASSNTTNTMLSSLSSVFKTYSATANGSYIKDIDDFTLTDEAAAKYLGTDGTQVGVYGGNLIYDENPTIPQITKCNVAAKSTADGKLSVDIEVKAAEY